MHLKIYSQEDEKLFKLFLTTNRQASVYHTLAWKNVIEFTYKYKSYYIIACENGNIKGILPLFWVNQLWIRKKFVCLPYSHMVQPLYDSDNVLEALLDFAEATTRQYRARYLQIKCDLSLKRDNWRYTGYFIKSILSLNREFDDIWRGVKSSTKRNIRKAQKKNVIIKIGHAQKDFKIFYELMVETRKRQGSPPYSNRFFDGLSRYFNPSQMRLYIALINNLPIAGLIMLYHGEYAIYAYGASTSDSSLLQNRPNDLLFWTAIMDASSMGYKIFDFGISPPSHHSLIRYKSQWGSINSKMIYSYYLNRANVVPGIDRESRLVKLTSSILRHMPVLLIKRIGPIMLKQLG